MGWGNNTDATSGGEAKPEARWEEGSVVGLLDTVEQGEYGPILTVKTDAGQQRKIYVGSKYDGPQAEAGTRATWYYDEKIVVGKKYGSKYLRGFDPQQNPAGGSGSASSPEKPQQGALPPAQSSDLQAAIVIVELIVQQGADLVSDEGRRAAMDQADQILALLLYARNRFRQDAG